MPEAREQTRWRTWLWLLGLLAAAPTLSAFFPELLHLSLRVRVVAAAVWLVAFVIIARQGVRTDENLDRLMGAAEREDQRLREQATTDLLDALLRPSTMDIPESYEFTVYLLEPETGLLTPMFTSGESLEDEGVFSPGMGATGSAFKRRRFMLVTGEHVSSDKFGLSEAQQDRFSGYQVVVAHPVLPPNGTDPIGVLTAISKSDDAHFQQARNRAALRQLSEDVGVVLTNVMGSRR